jgi:hypothetical protein
VTRRSSPREGRNGGGGFDFWWGGIGAVTGVDMRQEGLEGARPRSRMDEDREGAKRGAAATTMPFIGAAGE